MNSYPPELLVQLAPVVFVAGLDAQLPHVPPSPLPTTPNDALSPGLSATPAMPHTPRTPGGRQYDPFVLLAARVREALLAQRKVSVWQPEKAKTFQVVLVDKDVPFPPRKTLRPDDPHYNTAHSPLSPLTSSSPLHPDGLIAPIWVRKHTTLVPSVFVTFMRIYESPAGQDDREREVEERRRDTELANDIAQRKKSTNERGIKLTAVLMANRHMLDDPSLDARLTYIRRQSGLDPRAALFVLSPVSQAEIGDFVRSLQEALWEPAIEYYTNHSKRVRRKRNRHSQTNAYQLPHGSMPGTPIARPLRPEGWTVRYEYKMACFAEFRAEDQVALKHYQDAYSTLVIMFGSTAILPPRTKRWAEAKVLADCINVKIVKLYLYNNEFALALQCQNSHMRKFADFSRGWGIGEETFEFWSWLARQHRVFAELLEQGSRSTLKIPTRFTVPTPSAAAQALESSQIGMDAMRSLGLNPSQALQHPGFYYYMAARCTERRRERFLGASEFDANAPGFANEKKVDHLTIVLELYTRSYELFKKWTTLNSAQNPGRLPLWIAYRIAQTYHDSEKFEMAVRFFERIAKTYRRERWGSLLHPLLSQWYTSAQKMGDVDLSVKLLVEMLGHGPKAEDDSDTLQDNLLTVLKSTTPSAPEEPLQVDLSEAEPILHASVVFWEPEVNVGDSVSFQLSLTSPTNISLSAIPFSSLAIHFSADIPPMHVQHSLPDPDVDIPGAQRVDLGEVYVPAQEGIEGLNAALRWAKGTTIVFTGTLLSEQPQHVTVEKVVLTVKEGSWWIEIPILLAHRPPQHALYSPRWLVSLDPPRFLPIRREHHSVAKVRYRPHRVTVAILHNAPAYLGEEFPIELEITNSDDRELEIVVDVLLHPTENDDSDGDAANSIAMDDQRSTSLIKGIACGFIAPGVSVLKKLCLTNGSVLGDRVIDISVQSHAKGSKSPSSSPVSPSAPPLIDRSEKLRTLSVPVVQPLRVAHVVTYRRPTRPLPGLANLETFDYATRDESRAEEAVVTSTLTCMAPSGLLVESVKLRRKDSEFATIISSSVDAEDFGDEWEAGDELCDRCLINVVPDEEDPFTPAPGPGEYEIAWRRILPNGAHGSRATSRFPLPALQPPTDGLIALLDAPTTAHLHAAIPLRLTVRNRHPSRSANVTVEVLPDSTDAFVVAGLRHGRIPILLPGAEETLMWNLIPLECGLVKAPTIRVRDRRSAVQIVGASAGGAHAAEGAASAQTQGEVVKIVDVRRDGRTAVDAAETAVPDGKGGKNNDGPDVFVLVLP